MALTIYRSGMLVGNVQVFHRQAFTSRDGTYQCEGGVVFVQNEKGEGEGVLVVMGYPIDAGERAELRPMRPEELKPWTVCSFRLPRGLEFDLPRLPRDEAEHRKLLGLHG